MVVQKTKKYEICTIELRAAELSDCAKILQNAQNRDCAVKEWDFGVKIIRRSECLCKINGLGRSLIRPVGAF